MAIAPPRCREDVVKKLTTPKRLTPGNAWEKSSASSGILVMLSLPKQVNRDLGETTGEVVQAPCAIKKEAICIVVCMGRFASVAICVRGFCGLTVSKKCSNCWGGVDPEEWKVSNRSEGEAWGKSKV
jgi:hypothetical protein